MMTSVHYSQRLLSTSLSIFFALGAERVGSAQSGVGGPILPPTQTIPTQASPVQATGEPEYILRTRVPITILDIVVTDSKGHPVHNLKQSDFTIFEDNHEMKPTSFEEHRSDATPTPPPTLVKDTLPPNTFTNIVPTLPDAGPINILLLDSLNTPTQVQQIVQLKILDFIKKMTPGTRMAIFAFNYHLTILQGFTTDPEMLKAAITGKKNIAQYSPIEDPGQDPAKDFRPPESTFDMSCENPDFAARGQYTLTAMKQLARYLSGIPGRKNLIWFGGSFPTMWPPDTGSCFDFADEINSATDLLARAHVSIYPIDGRALDRIPRGKGQDRARKDEHYTMDHMADQTGGRATYTSNDLAGALDDAVDSGSNYYILTYTPTNRKLDNRFRNISVKVNLPGLHLVYRPGYYAVDPDIDLRGKRIDKVTAMQTAMMRGAPAPTQIFFKVEIAQTPASETALPSDNHPNLKQMKPPYRRYSVSYTTDINNITFSPSPDGTYHADFEFAAMVYNTDGDEVLNATTKEVRPILPAVTYQAILKSGAKARQEIAIPAKGDYLLRIAVHDLTSDRIGAIEIPLSSISP